MIFRHIASQYFQHNKKIKINYMNFSNLWYNIKIFFILFDKNIEISTTLFAKIILSCAKVRKGEKICSPL